MPTLWDWRRSAMITFLALPLGLRAERTYRALPALPVRPVNEPLPALSIIVPARNESDNLRVLLPSLLNLRYPGPIEIIVVDDNSSDDTAAIASELGARVVRLDHLPAGWLGKPHACHQGARAASGDWLLFTDADTIHAPNGAAAAVRYATQLQLDGVSLLLHPEPHNSIEHLSLMTAFAGLFAGLHPDRGMLNGQYILIRRPVYENVGGFAAVSDQALEDLALGKRLRERGYRVPLLHGEAAATVHMYADTSSAWRGLTRLGSGSLRFSGLGAIFTLFFITALMSPLITLVGVARGRLDRRWLPLTWAAVALSMFTWAQRYGTTAWALLTPFSGLLVQAAAVWGLLSRMLGRGVQWKGRRV